MSRAFVKDDDGGEGIEDLPDRTISPHPNVVTAAGLAHIEVELQRLTAGYAAAQTAADRIALQKLARDLRYWSARRATAQLQPEPGPRDVVLFGAVVTLLRADGRRQTWQIVGEDEADPKLGKISYVAPLAQALLGREVGDTVPVAGGEAEIVGIG